MIVEMFEEEEFKEYFSRFFEDFSNIYSEFQSKKDLYGDFWQFMLAKAAKELGLLDPACERPLTPGEIEVLYRKIVSLLPSASLKEEIEESHLDSDKKPGSLPCPPWFNLNLPDEKK